MGLEKVKKNSKKNLIKNLNKLRQKRTENTYIMNSNKWKKFDSKQIQQYYNINLIFTRELFDLEKSVRKDHLTIAFKVK